MLKRVGLREFLQCIIFLDGRHNDSVLYVCLVMIRSNNSRFVFALMNIKRRNSEALDCTFVLFQVCKNKFLLSKA
jgi:hypothetical protein